MKYCNTTIGHINVLEWNSIPVGLNEVYEVFKKLRFNPVSNMQSKVLDALLFQLDRFCAQIFQQ